jgi:hypothetical protein
MKIRWLPVAWMKTAWESNARVELEERRPPGKFRTCQVI